MTFMREDVAPMVLALHRLPKPSLAAVSGVAAGAGANLALGCDLVFAAEDARFSEIFVKRALSVDAGGSWLLPRLVGLRKAKELAFFGDWIGAAEAERLGESSTVGLPQLSATLWSPARRVAWIDGSPRSEGDLVGEHVVEIIEPNAVVLRRGDARLRLEMAGAEDPLPPTDWGDEGD